MIVSVMRDTKEHGVPYTEQCESTGLAYSSSNRWRYRDARGLEPVTTPGPKKMEPLDLEGLQDQIDSLRHGYRRTAGTGDLFEYYKDSISRRDLQKMVNNARAEANLQRKKKLHIIKWKAPGVMWAFDDAEESIDALGGKVHIHSIRDLGSRYTFEPLLGWELAKGPEIAENLAQLFRVFGAPLFLKRDNGGNLNHHKVNEILSRHYVIPLNSPPYYPQYNGGVEKGQYEIKTEVEFSDCSTMREAVLALRLGAHDINHRKRRVLSKKTPCAVFNGPDNRAGEFDKRRRKEIYDALTAVTAAFMELTEGRCTVDNAWRLVIETWLLKHGIISMREKRKCYPILCRLFAHY
jgi:hypothetical protein